MNIRHLLLAILLMMGTCISYGQIKICEEDSNHPIDYRIFSFRDSLLRKSVDTVIIYSH